MGSSMGWLSIADLFKMELSYAVPILVPVAI